MVVKNVIVFMLPSLMSSYESKQNFPEKYITIFYFWILFLSNSKIMQVKNFHREKSISRLCYFQAPKFN